MRAFQSAKSENLTNLTAKAFDCATLVINVTIKSTPFIGPLCVGFKKVLFSKDDLWEALAEYPEAKKKYF